MSDPTRDVNEIVQRVEELNELVSEMEEKNERLERKITEQERKRERIEAKYDRIEYQQQQMRDSTVRIDAVERVLLEYGLSEAKINLILDDIGDVDDTLRSGADE